MPFIRGGQDAGAGARDAPERDGRRRHDDSDEDDAARKLVAASRPAADEESGSNDGAAAAGAADANDDFFDLDEALDCCGNLGRFQVAMLLFTGLSWLVDACEVALLAYLAAAVKCEWGLTPAMEATLTSMVFLGMCLGAPVWGALSDARGRKLSFGLGMLVTCVFSFASAAAPNLAALMAFRTLVGFGIPSACVAFSWLSETVPAAPRGLYLVGIEGFWTVGTVLQALLAFGLLNKLGWRVLLTVSAVPTVIVLILLPFVPESPRWLAVQGRTEEAEAVLRRMLRFCGKSGALAEHRRLRPLHVPTPRARPPASAGCLAATAWRARRIFATVSSGMRGLTSRAMLPTSLVLVFVWMSSAHVYYGLSYLVGQIDFMSGGKKICDASLGGRLQIPTADLTAILITACAEVPGLALSLLLVHLCSRRVSFAAPMAAIAVVLIPLMAGVSNASAIAPLFLSRMFVYSAFAVVWTTSEVYPTSVRGFALGFNNSMSRIGGMLSSYVVAARATGWVHTPEAVFFALSLASAAALMLLPQRDAKGTHLADTVEDVEERRRLEGEELEAQGRSSSLVGRALSGAASGGGSLVGTTGGRLVARRKGGGGGGGGAGGFEGGRVLSTAAS
jgi:MFS family permease